MLKSLVLGWCEQFRWCAAWHPGTTKRIPFVKRYLPKNAVGAELGVFNGLFSPALLKHTEAAELHLVDPWHLLASEWSWARGNRRTINGLIKVLKSFKKEIENGRVIVHIGHDLDVLQHFPDEYFDWVYVDTSHTYDHTKKELAILSKKVKTTGIISGDDWWPDETHEHHGVFLAVNELVASTDYRLIYSSDQDQQWAIRRIIP